MGFVELDQNGYDPSATFSDALLFGDLPDATNIFEEPPIPPRIGEEYQAEIPPMLTESELLQLIPSCVDTKDMLGTEYHTEKGLPIPILWVQYPWSRKKKELEGSSNFSDTCGNSRNCQVNCLCCTVSGTRLDHLQPQASVCNQPLNCQTYDDEDAKESERPNALKACVCRPLPGSSVVSWSHAEKQSFLLGLYIFGKNLIQVEKFMGSKSTGDIQSYYYGEFYRSSAYSRWSECRKVRSRKCIYGHRIFTGSRQQELLSRLLCTVSEEVHGSLLEVTKTFSEGKTSLEEFISALKATVGLQILIEAVGIGGGKDDLTGYNLDSGRSSQSVSVCSKLPIGKTFSSLTSEDVIKFLTGDFRLSKAKSNDLFWEAVWPRLLAHGWHSEQPKHLSFVKSKHGLVFIVPGVKKFSRRKLVKGTHYFDSISDLLNKVSSDPKLLDLEVERSRESGNINNERASGTNANGPSSNKQQFYLRPKYPACNADLTRFTIVDTSMIQGDAPFKIRELRSLPLDSKHGYCPPRGETQSDSSEEMLDSGELSVIDQIHGESPMCNDNNPKEDLQPEMSDCFVPIQKKKVPSDAENCDPKCFDLLKHKQPAKDIKFQFSRRPKPGQPESLTHVSKRRRLTACKNAETACPTDSSYGDRINKETCLKFDPCNASGVCLIALPAHESARTYSPDRVKLDGRNEYPSQGIDDGSNSQAMMIDEKPPVRSWLDLNFRPDSDNKEPLLPETSSLLSDTEKPAIITHAPERCTFEPGYNQPTMNARRQSTRSRPLTMKALEALETGFLSPTHKWRDVASDNSSSKSSRRARKSSKASDPSVQSDVCAGESSKILVAGNDLEYKHAYKLFGVP